MPYLGTILALVVAAGMAAAAMAEVSRNFETARLRAASGELLSALSHYRLIHCGLAAGTTVSAANVLSDANAFAGSANGVDPAAGVFAWRYDTDANALHYLVVTDDIGVRSRLQAMRGGTLAAPNLLRIPVPRRSAVSLPNLDVNTRGETNGNPDCF